MRQTITIYDETYFGYVGQDNLRKWWGRFEQAAAEAIRLTNDRAPGAPRVVSVFDRNFNVRWDTSQPMPARS